MKLSIQSKNFANALTAISKVIEKKSVMPITECALITNRNGKYYATGVGANQEHQLTVEIRFVEVPMSNKYVPVCIPVFKMLEILSLLPPQIVDMEIDEQNGFKTTIKFQSGEITMMFYDGMLFPTISPIQEDDALIFSLPSDVMTSNLKAAADNAVEEDIRVVMNAAVMDVSQEGVTFVGSDSHKLYRSEWHHGMPYLEGGKPAQVLVQKKMINAMAMLASGDDIVTLKYNGRNVQMECGENTLISRTIEGRYPNYNSVIPKDNPYTLKVKAKELAHALRLASLTSSEASKLIRMEYKHGKVFFVAEDFEFARDSRIELNYEECNLPEYYKIGFKSTIMQGVIDNIPGEDINITFGDKSRSILLKSTEPNTDVLQLVMPMHID
ncbi:MAG: hypothetical protein HUK06_01620 [Bacteroidaceae bacterium]|nr:hypothetical protein [Bacteroidaceae bacterium]